MTSEQEFLTHVAADLAATLAGAVPQGFTVSANGTRLMLQYDGELSGRLLDLSLELGHYPEETLHQTAQRGSQQVLDDIQDEVTETTRTAWPAAPGQASPARAYAELDGDALRLGYVDAVEFPPIQLS